MWVWVCAFVCVWFFILHVSILVGLYRMLFPVDPRVYMIDNRIWNSTVAYNIWLLQLVYNWRRIRYRRNGLAHMHLFRKGITKLLQSMYKLSKIKSRMCVCVQ